MIGYVTLGTNDMERAKAFYDALLAPVGGRRGFAIGERFVLYSAGRERPGIALVKPYDGRPHEPGNGQMTALVVRAPEQVDQLHALALSLGGSDEGAPGDRGFGFYGGYFRDPDGNKLNFFCMQAPLSP